MCGLKEFSDRPQHFIKNLAHCFKGGGHTPNQPVAKSGDGRNLVGRIDELKMVDATRNAAPGNWHANARDLCAHLVAKGATDEEIEMRAPSIRQDGYTLEQTLEDMSKLVTSARKKGFAPDSESSIDCIPDMSIIQEGSRPAPPFPLDALPAKLKTFASALAISKGSPVDYVICGIFVMGAGLVGNARLFSPWTNGPNPAAFTVPT